MRNLDRGGGFPFDSALRVEDSRRKEVFWATPERLLSIITAGKPRMQGEAFVTASGRFTGARRLEAAATVINDVAA
jgi:hypothetical protein